MSSVEKIQITGVRSFWTEQAQALDFFTPLTLIVGQNGTGKTTIIECLKYATTGELPPNSKGGAFIHDPALTGSRESKAQIKLRFRATTGARMVVTRNSILTMKKSARQQRVQECNLKMTKNGEKTSLSSRVAELDAILPQYLGVSKAVLDNVIFCHQDESLWPMSEPGMLKKKFDEIFEALKYTKAIENLKQLRKRQGEELSKFKIIEEHAKDDKEKADRSERRCRELASEIESLRTETSEMEEKAKEATDKAEEAWKRATRYTETVELLKFRREKWKLLQRSFVQLGQDLEEERDEPDDWLRSELESQEAYLKACRDSREEGHRQFQNLNREIERARDDQGRKRVEAGKFQQQKSTYEQQVRDLQELVRNTAREYNLRGYDGELDEDQVEDFVVRINQLAKDHNARIEQLQRKSTAEIAELQEGVDGLLRKQSAMHQVKENVKQQQTLNDHRASLLKEEVDKIYASEGDKALSEVTVRDLKERLSKVEQEFASMGWSQRLKDIDSQVQKCEQQAELLGEEIIQQTDRSADAARLEILRKDIKDKERSAATVLATYRERLRNMLGHDVEVSTLEKDVSQTVEQQKKDFEHATRRRDSTNRELEQMQFQLVAARAQLKQKENELSIHENSLRDVIDDKPEHFLEVLSERQENRDTRANDVKSFEVLKEWYAGCIATAQSEKPACRLCKRGFDDQRALHGFIRNLERAISTGALAQLQGELQQYEVQLRLARDLRGGYDLWLRLKDVELPDIREQIRSLQEKKQNLVQKVESCDMEVNEREEVRRNVESNAAAAASLIRIHNDIAQAQHQAEELASTYKVESKLRSLESIQNEMIEVSRQTRESRASQAKLQAEEKQSRDLIMSLELELSNAKNRLLEVSAELDKKTTRQAQIEELRQSGRHHRLTLNQQDEQLHSLEPELLGEQNRLLEHRQAYQAREKDLQQQASNISDSVRRLTRIGQEIRGFLEDGGPTKLAQCERDIEAKKNSISSMEAESLKITLEITRIQQKLADQDRIRRIINDNLKYRQAKQELQEDKAEIERLEAQNAEADQSRCRKEFEHWEKLREIANTEKTSKLGTMKAKDDLLDELLREWDRDYKNADKKYKKAHIEVATTKAAVEDLGKYGNALDQAVMKYHSLKMEEINNIIEELWKTTYQGTDVDTIFIRSENETGKGNRNYNYRVCMVKQGAEMDMRGRCSAGQRVLASIIIRLALAECFGVNCGLIALDEPTTNLDRDNIKSLAESLHDIIQVRRQQSNFQLIVITHDEEFLRHMRCADFCEHYYRVDRADNQTSTIERQSVVGIL